MLECSECPALSTHHGGHERQMIVVGIGTDIIECLRVAQMIERHGELFLARVFTPHEIEYCSARKAATQHYAGRFAAKEAVLKALGTGWTRGVQWRDIEVRNDFGGKPKIALSGGAREMCESLGVSEMLISISHCRTHATAYVLAVGNGDATVPAGPKPDREE
jgi:holo-[acyl-carrier protein] synthase